LVIPVVLSFWSAVSAGVLFNLPRIVTDRAYLHRTCRIASASVAEGVAAKTNAG
jgi:hypothetical protein